MYDFVMRVYSLWNRLWVNASLNMFSYGLNRCTRHDYDLATICIDQLKTKFNLNVSCMSIIWIVIQEIYSILKIVNRHV